MNDHGMMIHILVLLASAVVIVPLAHSLGLGSVMGYLIAGVLIGPSVLNLVGDTSSLGHVSELGIVFLLFIIGLELEPQRLWKLKSRLIGLGLGQLALIALFTVPIGFMAGWGWAPSLVAGVGIALSSTAIAVQLLRDRSLFSTPTGESAFAILLFQDLAVIPIVALLPLLGSQVAGQASEVSIVKLIAVILAIILAGHFLLRHIFRIVALTQLREVFTALSLLFVVGLAAVMASMGASMALGAFLGGILLANSEYRHAIETDIEPFKGLLLGLFFMSVGMSIDLKTLAQSPLLILGLVLGSVAIKIVAHQILARFAGLSIGERPFFSIVLSQIGEFAFVLFASAETLGIFTRDQKVILSASVALSMVTTPILMLFHDRVLAPRLTAKKKKEYEQIENENPEVIIAGFGRVGQIIARMLYANRMRATVLDHDPDQIEFLREFGFKVYYGDATRLDLLRSAGAETAKILVVAIDDIGNSLKLIDLARENFPHLKIVARARNVGHVYDLIDRKVSAWQRETFESSMSLGVEVLKILGMRPYQAVRAADRFRDHNLQMIDELHDQRSDRVKLVSRAKQARLDLEQMFAEDEEHIARQHKGWDFDPNRPDRS